MILKVTRTEMEILRCTIPELSGTFKNEVSFTFLAGMGLPDLTRKIDEGIERMERDDWARWKSWTRARGPLIEKIRKATFGIVQGEKKDPEPWNPFPPSIA